MNRISSKSLWAVCALCWVCVIVAPARAQDRIQSPPAGTAISGELIAKLVQGTKPEEVVASCGMWEGRATGLAHDRTLSPLAAIHLWTYDATRVNGDELHDWLKENPNVVAVQHNHYVAERATPNDPQFGSQWHHIDASDNHIDSDLAWDIATGGSTANGDRIVVAVLEGGGAACFAER